MTQSSVLSGLNVLKKAQYRLVRILGHIDKIVKKIHAVIPTAVRLFNCPQTLLGKWASA